MLDKNTELKYEIDGQNLTAKICPCSWMYTDYGLQVQITNEIGGYTYKIKKGKSFDEYTDDDFCDLAYSVKLRTCRYEDCDNVAFDEDGDEEYGHANNRCERCRVRDITEEFKAACKEEEEENLRTRAGYYNGGARHIAIVWIHPRSGDDYQIEICSSHKIEDEEIRSIAKKHGSVELDDFTVGELLPNGEILYANEAQC